MDYEQPCDPEWQATEAVIELFHAALHERYPTGNLNAGILLTALWRMSGRMLQHLAPADQERIMIDMCATTQRWLSLVRK